MKYFISGAITKHISTPKGREEVTDKFIGAEFDLLTSQIATEVFNPIRIVDEYGWEQDWRFYMNICLKILLESDGVMMLKGWEDSRGARIEHGIAKELELNIIYE